MKFEKMDIWHRAVSLSCGVYKNTASLKDFGFRDQLTRSGLSIASNIAEGFERESVKESINFLRYAKASAGEFYTQVIIGKEVGFIESDLAEGWLSEAREMAAILGSIIKKRRDFN